MDSTSIGFLSSHRFGCVFEALRPADVGLQSSVFSWDFFLSPLCSRHAAKQINTAPEAHAVREILRNVNLPHNIRKWNLFGREPRLTRLCSSRPRDVAFVVFWMLKYCWPLSSPGSGSKGQRTKSRVPHSPNTGGSFSTTFERFLCETHVRILSPKQRLNVRDAVGCFSNRLPHRCRVGLDPTVPSRGRLRFVWKRAWVWYFYLKASAHVTPVKAANSSSKGVVLGEPDHFEQFDIALWRKVELTLLLMGNSVWT